MFFYSEELEVTRLELEFLVKLGVSDFYSQHQDISQV